MSAFMGLRLDEHYRSSTHQIGRDLYGELLPHATLYQRAVGFFASSVFTVAAEAFSSFFSRGGRMELVCSPWFSRADAEACVKGVLERAALRRIPTERMLEHGSWRQRRAELLGWLLATDRLQIRIALRADPFRSALYHEKIGVFQDGQRDLVACSGSANESFGGLVANFERLDVFRSWGEGDERRRAYRIERHFQELWRKETAGLEVIELHEAVARNELLVRPAPSHKGESTGGPPEKGTDPPERIGRAVPEVLVPAPGITLFEHQREAMVKWGEARGRGLLEMATGSGKTITALSIASKLYDGLGGPLLVLIVAPMIHLVDQWRGVATLFGLHPIRCAEGQRRWEGELSSAIHALNHGGRSVLSVATTADTLANPVMQELLGMVRGRMLVIADEAHNYGSAGNIRALPKNAQFRVALSATPDRWMDQEGTARLREYFGDVVFRFTLADAIEREILTPYRYNPVLIDLDEDELDEYLELTRLLARYLGSDIEETDNNNAKKLLFRRARLIGAARNKLPKLRELMEPLRDDSHILVYCGDGRVDDGEPESESTIRQIEAVVAMLGREMGMRCASYTADTPADRRKQLLEDFANGELQVLVAIRCLDEGVDVPVARTAFLLASSTNPRQFIQRRGRVLRRAPGKKRAVLYDFFVSPPWEGIDRSSPEYKVIRGMLLRQVHRAREFAELAENGPVARRALLALSSHFDLLSEWEAPP